MFRILAVLHRWIFFRLKLKFVDVNESNFFEEELSKPTLLVKDFVAKAGEKNYQSQKKIVPRKLKNYCPDLWGFYMLEVRRDTNVQATGNLSISFKNIFHQNAANDTEDVWLTLPSNRLKKRVIKLDSSLKISQLNVAGESFSAFDDLNGIEITFVKISERFAKSRMLRKLLSRGLTDSQINGLSLEEMFLHYNKLFLPNVEKSSYQHLIEKEKWTPLCKDQGLCFSVVIPIYNTPENWLKDCIESVQNQIYPNWQLVLVDDASKSSHVKKVLEDYSFCDSRINVIFLKKPSHICNTTNAGILRSKGDFVTFLDHDDVLSPYALNELASVINKNRKLRLIYSDEDLMSESGERLHPHFKPDWNPELLSAHNYVTHLACYEKTLLHELGNLREGFEGAQDFDLVLRAKQVLTETQIYHIPKILYHWRMVEGSTAFNPDAKNYATDAGLQALTDHFKSINKDARIQHGKQTNFYRVLWPLPDAKTKISIIIPTRNGKEILEACIESIIKTADWDNYEIIVVDNGSNERDSINYLASLNKHSNIKVLKNDTPFNFSSLNNFGAEHASGEILLLLNNDIEATHRGWLSEMLSLVVRDEVGCVGAKLLYPDGSIQHAGVILGLGGYAAHSHRGSEGSASGYFNRLNVRQNLSAVTAACLMVRKEVYFSVGGLDESFQVAYNDVDFCLRVRAAGFKNVFTPFATLIHHESKTRGEENSKKDVQRFDSEKARLYGRWSEVIDHDPAYNPNLTRSREDFSYL